MLSNFNVNYVTTTYVSYRLNRFEHRNYTDFPYVRLVIPRTRDHLVTKMKRRSKKEKDEEDAGEDHSAVATNRTALHCTALHCSFKKMNRQQSLKHFGNYSFHRI